jgi:tyrosyl-tRNA synthetase
MLLRLQNSQQADICQLGMDQRKVNVLAREYCDDIKRKNKPIILSHRMLLIPLFKTCVMILFSFLNKVRLTPHFMNADMLPGLQQGQEKMSKSDPSSSIFMEDEEVCCGFIHGEF